MGYSLWGKIEHSFPLVRGVRLVLTSGHGGIIVSKKFAEKNLSESALKRGVVYGNYYSYEEDCDFAIPLFEIRKAWDNYFNKEMDYYEKEQHLIRSLSRWNADYLLEIGVEPSEEEYKQFKDDKLIREMLNERHPDLVITVFGERKTKIPGVVEVHTADKKVYHAKITEKYKNSSIKRLSNLKDVKEI